MKNYRLYLALLLILMIGCLTTGYAKQYYEQAEPVPVKARIMTEDSTYMDRLNELDERIEEISESKEDTSNALRSSADQERKAWEAELERLLDLLSEQLSEEEKSELMREQTLWKKEREHMAQTSSKLQRGSSMEELAYLLSVAESTRERVYELAEEYQDILAETN